MLNIHHLELYYYVARHGGISRAVRHIPYGIQQPAVSGQILQLEEDLGLKLFERSPFRLTPAGEELYAFVCPFFENVDAIEARLRAGTSPVLRIGAGEMVLRHSLQGLIAGLRRRHPKLRISLRSGTQADLERMLAERSIDLAISPIERRAPKGIRVAPLMKIPLVLLLPNTSRVKSVEELLSNPLVGEALVCQPDTEPVGRRFRQFLKERKVSWPTTIEANTVDTVEAYVANGYGIGVGVAIHRPAGVSKVRILPLPDIEPLVVAALWQGEAGPFVSGLVAEAKSLIREKAPAMACDAGAETDA